MNSVLPTVIERKSVYMQNGSQSVRDEINEIFQWALTQTQTSQLNQDEVKQRIRQRLSKSEVDKIELNSPLAVELEGVQVELTPLALCCALGWQEVALFMVKDDSLITPLNHVDSVGRTPLDWLELYFKHHRIQSNHNLLYKTLESLGAQKGTQEKPLKEDDDVKPTSLTRMFQLLMDDTLKDDLVQQEMTQIMASTAPTEQPKPPMPQTKYLAIQGGGAKGAAYMGSLQSFDEQGLLDDVSVVAGASAGAITAFCIGLGLDSEQFAEKIGKKINFLDFTQLDSEGWSSTVGGTLGPVFDLFSKGGMFTGKSFHHWASFMCDQILDDPNATFQDLHDRIQEDPTLKDLVFKGTRYQPRPGEEKEQTFSYKTTPNVLIADAVRASMAFPAAFIPWKVRERDPITNELKDFGRFADGGLQNNYPIDLFGQSEFEDPHYPLIEYKSTRVNPSSLGWSLTSKLEKLDPNITPLTSRLEKLKRQSTKKGASRDTIQKAKRAHELANARTQWSNMDIVYAVWDNKVGQVKEDLTQKVKQYHDRTVQIYTEGVQTLEFNAPPEKLARIIESGRAAQENWFKHFRGSDTHYENAFVYGTADDLRLQLTDPAAYYLQKCQDHFESYSKEIIRLNRTGHVTDQDLANNACLKFHNFHLQRLYQDMTENPKVDQDAIIATAFKRAKDTVFTRDQQLHHKRKEKDRILNTQTLLQTMKDVIEEDKYKAKLIFDSQLTMILDLCKTPIGDSGKNLLGILIETNDARIVRYVLNSLQYNLDQIYYQSRTTEFPYSLADMLNEFCKPNALERAVELNNTALVDLLLEKGADPFLVLKKDQQFYTPVHRAIELGDYQGFKHLIDLALKQGNLASQSWNQRSLLHFIFEQNATNEGKDFLAKLADDPDTIKRLFDANNLDSSGLNAFEYGACLAKDTSDLVWRCLVTVQPKLHYEEERGKAIVKVDQNALDEETLYDVRRKLSSGQLNIKDLEGLSDTHYVKLLSGSREYSNLVMEAAAHPDDVKLTQWVHYFLDKVGKHAKVHQMIHGKVLGKTPLFVASEQGNYLMVDYLRQRYDASVNDAGPITQPCALMAAATRGHSKVLKTLMDTYRGTYGYSTRMTRGIKDNQGRNVFHLMAMSSSITPEAFWSVLQRSIKTIHIVQKDSKAQTPFRLLVENDRADIILYIASQASDHRTALNTIFGWDSKYPDSLQDLIYLRRINNSLYNDLVQNHMSDPNTALLIDEQVKQRSEDLLSSSAELQRQFPDPLTLDFNDNDAQTMVHPIEVVGDVLEQLAPDIRQLISQFNSKPFDPVTFFPDNFDDDQVQIFIGLNQQAIILDPERLSSAIVQNSQWLNNFLNNLNLEEISILHGFKKLVLESGINMPSDQKQREHLLTQWANRMVALNSDSLSMTDTDTLSQLAEYLYQAIAIPIPINELDFTPYEGLFNSVQQLQFKQIYHNISLTKQKHFDPAMVQKVIRHIELVDILYKEPDKVETLKPEECFELLNSRDRQGYRIHPLASDPSIAPVLITLCKKASKHDSKAFKSLLEAKTPVSVLYKAAVSNNPEFVRFLRHEYDLDVDDCGLANNPSALTAAASRGHNDVVQEIIASYKGNVLGYTSVSRRVVDSTNQGKTPLHHLAEHGTPEAFCSVLFGGGVRSSPTEVFAAGDQQEQTPFDYLMKFNRIDILKEIIKQGKGMWGTSRFTAYDYGFLDLLGIDKVDGHSFKGFAYGNQDTRNFVLEHLSPYLKAQSPTSFTAIEDHIYEVLRDNQPKKPRSKKPAVLPSQPFSEQSFAPPKAVSSQEKQRTVRGKKPK